MRTLITITYAICIGVYLLSYSFMASAQDDRPGVWFDQGNSQDTRISERGEIVIKLKRRNGEVFRCYDKCSQVMGVFVSPDTGRFAYMFLNVHRQPVKAEGALGARECHPRVLGQFVWASLRIYASFNNRWLLMRQGEPRHYDCTQTNLRSQ